MICGRRTRTRARRNAQAPSGRARVRVPVIPCIRISDGLEGASLLLLPPCDEGALVDGPLLARVERGERGEACTRVELQAEPEHGQRAQSTGSVRVMVTGGEHASRETTKRRGRGDEGAAADGHGAVRRG
jgi:hypothetical protein